MVFFDWGAGGLSNGRWFFARHGEKATDGLGTKRTRTDDGQNLNVRSSISGIVAGQGGKQGHDMLKNAGGAKKLEDAINSIIKYVTETATSEQLEIAGYKRDGEGIVVNLVNGRPFNASDAEHFLCKAWMIGKLTLAHYNTKFPRPTRPHCHPVKLTKDENPECTEVDIVMLGITAAFQAQRKLLKTPNFCLSKRELMPELG